MLTLAPSDTIGGVAGTATAITYTLFGMEYVTTPTETYKKLQQGQLGTSAATIYTATAVTAFIKKIIFANTTANAVSGVTIYSGGTAAANQLNGSWTIPAYGTLTLTDTGFQMLDQYGNILTNSSNVVDTTGLAALSAATAGINSTETVVLSATLAANTLKVGSTFRPYASGVCTSSAANASNFRVRIGTAGTSADAIAAVVTPTAAATGTAIPFSIDFLVNVRSIGSGGTIIGSGNLTNNGVTGVSAAASVVGQVTTAVTVNTTVQNIIQISYVAAAATTTCTFHNAAITLAKL